LEFARRTFEASKEVFRAKKLNYCLRTVVNEMEMHFLQDQRAKVRRAIFETIIATKRTM
jgi:uncharacterized membrane protein YqiK